MPHWLPRQLGVKSYLKKQSWFKVTQFQPFRWRNCFKLARRVWIKKVDTRQRKADSKKLLYRDVFTQRIYAACNENGLQYKYFISALYRMNIELDRKTLSYLAIWEPRTFKSIVELAKAKVAESAYDDYKDVLKPPPGVITRGML
ncbi:hypothetical protein B4U80_08131 [Leptotrombidium deliense]|uniref:Large ribosomal subunit protein bL20m n=1 Tax=Leptotrombidium deliense TaxID=299467 RepID=A0A443S840_9ACAR|nr:hypothetical protein B4U80_08131 [Leptotrombidium deliense]